MTLNTVEYLHALNGHTFSTMIETKLSDILFGDSIEFKVEKQALGIFYLEVPKRFEIEVVLLRKFGSSKKLVATTSSLNADVDSFLKVKGFRHIHVIQIRELLSPGETYSLKFRSLQPELSFTNEASRCQSVTLHATI